jgi:uncharacterized protein YdhG (YjbR/CyaY superfamily)
MPEKKTSKTSRSTARTRSGSNGFTADERAAMMERARELKAARAGKADGEQSVLEKIAAMPEPDRTLAGRLHEIIRAVSTDLTPRLWYGMPAYAKDGKVLCFFQGASKFKARYATVGFSDVARLDDGSFWPVGFAVLDMTPAIETKLRALVKKAVRS